MSRWLTLVLLVLAPTARSEPPPIAAAYHGDFLVHPGATLRIEGPAARSSAGRRALLVEAQATTWWHPRNMLALQLRAGPALRLVGPRGGLWGAFAHLGAMRGTWATPSYRVDGQGAVSRAPLAGDAWWVVATGIELGRELHTGRLDAWFVRPQLGLRLPTVRGYGLDLAVEVGVRFGGAR